MNGSPFLRDSSSNNSLVFAADHALAYLSVPSTIDQSILIKFIMLPIFSGVGFGRPAARALPCQLRSHRVLFAHARHRHVASCRMAVQASGLRIKEKYDGSFSLDPEVRGCSSTHHCGILTHASCACTNIVARRTVDPTRLAISAVLKW